MNNLTNNQNLELYLNWEKEASIFWQEIVQYQSKQDKIDNFNRTRDFKTNCLKKQHTPDCNKSSTFWEELAAQRTDI